MTSPNPRRWLPARLRLLGGVVPETYYPSAPSSPEGGVGYSLTPWPWEGAAPSHEPAPSLREALLVATGVCLTRWLAGPGDWEVEARADGLDTLLHFRLESLDRLDAMAELLGGGSPAPLIDALNVLVAVAGEVVEPIKAQRVLGRIRAEARALAGVAPSPDRLLPKVLVECLDPDPLAAAQSAQSGVIHVAAALGIGPLAEIRRWQEEVLELATPWRASPPDLTPLVDPLIARREAK